jgi:phosphatidylglycerophosphate synthase
LNRERRAKLMIAHALTAVRLVLIAPFACWMYADTARAADASDFLDGAVARRLGTQSALGRAFDHGTDCAFVTCGLAALAARDGVPWLLPALVALAFAQYVVDSYWLHRQRELRMSELGRWNGILYFVPLGVDIALRLGVAVPALTLCALAWLLIGSTLISIADRALAVRGAS